MLRASLLAIPLAGALVLAACAKDDKGKTPSATTETAATAVVGVVGPDGVRTISIEAGMKGYVPDKIVGAAGEKLRLVFTRTIDGECLAELKTPDGAMIELPKGSPVEVAVTVPESGSLTFACGMDMFHAQIVPGAT